LIVFDEVQACGRALTSLKYFHEAASQYRIIAAGSTLGISVKSGPLSFPVGNVEMLTLLPLDFEEFLEALGETLLVAAINAYLRERKVLNSSQIQRDILSAYTADMTSRDASRCTGSVSSRS